MRYLVFAYLLVRVWSMPFAAYKYVAELCIGIHHLQTICLCAQHVCLYSILLFYNANTHITLRHSAILPSA